MPGWSNIIWLLPEPEGFCRASAQGPWMRTAGLVLSLYGRSLLYHLYFFHGAELWCAPGPGLIQRSHVGPQQGLSTRRLTIPGCLGTRPTKCVVMSRIRTMAALAYVPAYLRKQ